MSPNNTAQLTMKPAPDDTLHTLASVGRPQALAQLLGKQPQHAQYLKTVKTNLIAALSRLNDATSELVKRGLASRKSYGLDVHDTHHPRYAEYRDADSAYWTALDCAERLGLVTVHTHSFSWNIADENNQPPGFEPCIR